MTALRVVVFRTVRQAALLCVVFMPMVAQAERDDRTESSAIVPARSSSTDEVQVPVIGRDDLDRFKPPQRTISDITELLEQYDDTNREELERMRALADLPRPPEASARKLVDFLNERARAAGVVGRTQRQIADLEEAIQLLREAGLKQANDFAREENMLQVLSHANAYNGNFERAVELREESAALEPTFAKYMTLSRYYVQLGDLEVAKSMQHRYKKMLGKTSVNRIWRNVALTNETSADANLLAATGQYAEAERGYRRALEIIQRDEGNDNAVGNFYDLATVRVIFVGSVNAKLSRLLAHQGRLAEAELAGRNGLSAFLGRFGKYSTYTAEVLVDLADVLNEQNRPEEAESLARAALEIRAKIGAESDGSLMTAEARRSLARALLMQDRWEDALESFRQLSIELAPAPTLLEHGFRGDPDWALGLIYNGRPQEALRNLGPSLAKRRDLAGNNHYDVAEMLGVVAMAKSALGDRAGSLEAYSRAVPVLLRRAQRVGGGALRTRRRIAILEGYLNLLSDVQGTALEKQADISAAVEAFTVAEAARGQVVERALASSAARGVLTSPGVDANLAELARQEQDARQRIGAYEKLIAQTLASGVTGEQLNAVLRTLRARIAKLRSASEQTLARIEREFPDYGQLVNPKPATLAEARRALAAGEILLTFYSGAQSTYVWAVPAKGQPAFFAVPMRRETLERRVAKLRLALEPDAETLADIPAYDLEAAHALFTTLLGPTRATWQDASHLIVVPHGGLSSLPIALLPSAPPGATAHDDRFVSYRDVAWLVRDYAVTRLPSTGSLVALRRAAGSSPAELPFLGFADPVFGPESDSNVTRGGLVQRLALRATPRTREADSASLAALPRLPETAEEVNSIARALGARLDRDVHLREAASESRVASMNESGTLDDYRVISFATHGLVPGDLDGLTQPALALSAPAPGDTDQDGLLTMQEILGLRLNADWAILSACNTAAAEGEGAEAISGLGRAFFYAGTRSLLVSNWPVHSEATKELMTRLFEIQSANPSLSRAEAFRRTMLALIDEGGFEEGGSMVFSYAHPIFWAPFSLVGS